MRNLSGTGRRDGGNRDRQQSTDFRGTTFSDEGVSGDSRQTCQRLIGDTMERITRSDWARIFRRQDISALMFVLFLSLAMVAILAVVLF